MLVGILKDNCMLLNAWGGRRMNFNLFFTTFHFYHLQSGVYTNVVSCHCCRNTTLSGLVNVVAELIHFVGWISTVALRLENNATFLLYFILDFYETVCILFILAFKIPILFAFFKLKRENIFLVIVYRTLWLNARMFQILGRSAGDSCCCCIYR